MSLQRVRAEAERSRPSESHSSKRLTKLIGLEPDTASDNAHWPSITLESFAMTPGQTPEYSLEHYVVSIALGPNTGGQIRRIMHNKCEKTAFVPGLASICPIHRPHFIETDTHIQILSLNLHPELLHLHTRELLNRDHVELIPKLNIQDGLIYQIGLALQADLQRPVNADRIYGETLANSLAVHLLQNYSTTKTPALDCEHGLSRRKLQLVTAYINDNLERELSLKELAAVTQLSQYHFCRLFKRSTGLSPHKYVTRQRVEKAKRLLKQGSMTLAEIAVACGFTHQSHLHRHFKRQTGVTPKNWLNS